MIANQRDTLSHQNSYVTYDKKGDNLIFIKGGVLPLSLHYYCRDRNGLKKSFLVNLAYGSNIEEGEVFFLAV